MVSPELGPLLSTEHQLFQPHLEEGEITPLCVVWCGLVGWGVVGCGGVWLGVVGCGGMWLGVVGCGWVWWGVEGCGLV